MINDQYSLFDAYWVPVDDPSYTRDIWYSCGSCGHYHSIYLKGLFKYGYGHECPYCHAVMVGFFER